MLLVFCKPDLSQCPSDHQQLVAGSGQHWVQSEDLWGGGARTHTHMHAATSVLSA